jgi:two-component system, OmpR family, sensor histidine kinase QseC
MTRRASLAGHLLAWTLGALMLVWAVFIAFGYRTGQREADELTDGHLATVAAVLLSTRQAGLSAPLDLHPPPGTLPLKAHDYQQSLSVVMWDAQGRVLTHAGNAGVPPFAAQAEGFATLVLGQPDARWRVFSRWSPDRSRKVMVLLSLRERDALARDIAEQMVEPGLWLLPAIALALGLAVRRGLKPLFEVSRQVHDLDIHEARALPLPAQRELADAVEAVNRLVERYHAALTRERDLASELAHELRTPLAALALQARALRELPGDGAHAEAAARVEQQALRAGEVLSHLLTLARAQRAELDEAVQPVDLCELARAVVAGFAPQAHEGGRELALVGSEPLVVRGHATLLELALRNLVENSLSHTPRSTVVEVQVDAAACRVQVCDHWPAGVDPAPQGPALGLGLGHRVVRKIAQIHGARFERDGHCHRLVFAG